MGSRYVRMTVNEFIAIREAMESNDASSGGWADSVKAEHDAAMKAVRATERRNYTAILEHCKPLPVNGGTPE